MNRRAASKSLTQAPALRRSSGVKGYQIADHRSGAERSEAVVDLFELDFPGDEVIEMQAALQIELDQAWHIDAEAIGPHEGSLDLAFAEEIGAVELDLCPDRDHADDRRRTARR